MVGLELTRERWLDLECWGTVDYAAALHRQEELAAQRRAGSIGDRLLLLEHAPVYTMGRRDSSQDLLCGEADLPAPLYRVSRGGEVTYHGPGQLVGYLLARLSAFPFGLRELVSRLEATFIELLAQRWQLAAERDPQHRGVWLGRDKIVALGLAVHAGVTMHGFAFNLCPDLRYYQSIVPCGVVDRGVTTLARALGGTALLPSMGQVQRWVGDKLADVLEYAGVNQLGGGCGGQ